MARIPMVTRTVTSTHVKALVVNPETREFTEEDFILPRTYENDAAIEKALIPAITDGIKFVAVVSANTVAELRGMTEADFIKYSHKIAKEEDENGKN